MKITGELLKAERINKNLSVQDVAHALKLSSRIVRAIENGHIEELPAKTFVRGFVKSYADYLKIDTEAVLKQFHEEMGSTLPVNRNLSQAQDPNPSNLSKKSGVDFGASAESISGKKYEDGLTKKNITYFAIVMALIIAIVTINKIISHYENEVTSPVANATTKTQLVNVESVNTASGTTVQTTAAQESVPTSSGPTTATTTPATVAPTNALTKNEQQPNKQPVEQLQIPTEKSKGTPVEMLLEAKKDTTIEYAKGNTTIFKKMLLRANTYEILKSNTGLHIRAEDGSLINVTINGVNKGQLSPSSKSVELTY